MSHKHAPRGPIKAKGDDPLREDDPLRGPGWRGCTARSKRSGKPCNGIAIQGGHVCRMHGGAAEQVIAKAKERIAAMVPKALRVQDELMDAVDYPTVRFQASKFIIEQDLGRAKESVAVNLTASLAEMTDEQLRAKALELAGVPVGSGD